MIPKLLLVGLGNPGIIYSNTRHNLGSHWILKLCQRYNQTLKLKHSLRSNITYIEDLNVICMVPEEYMNNSGTSVKLVVKYYNITLEDLLVVYDDLDLNVGTIKLKLNGGHGGHNGIKDLLTKLSTDQFKRLRIGIGRPNKFDSVSDYVLSKASRDEQCLIDQAIEHSLSIVTSNLPMVGNNWSKIIQLLHTNTI